MYENPKILISCRGAASGKIHISKEKSFVTNNSIVLNEKQKIIFTILKNFLNTMILNAIQQGQHSLKLLLLT